MSFQHYQVTNDLQTPIIGTSSDNKYDSYVDQLKKLKIKIISKSEEEIVFDLIGVEAPIANALRRILLAEVSKWSHIVIITVINNNSFTTLHY